MLDTTFYRIERTNKKCNDALHIGRNCCFYGDVIYEKEKALVFFRILDTNLTPHGWEWVLFCSGVKLQEKSDDTPESCKLGRRKKKYPEDKREAQEKLAPT